LKKSVLLFAFFLLHFQFVHAQNELQSFLKPSDTLNQTRLKGVVLSEGVLASGALIGLNQLWYKDYPKSNFHFINDNNQWLQMVKVEHFYSTYHLGRVRVEMF
jgi:hypothetical protein